MTVNTLFQVFVLLSPEEQKQVLDELQKYKETGKVDLSESRAFLKLLYLHDILFTTIPQMVMKRLENEVVK